MNGPEFAEGKKACLTLFDPEEEYVFKEEHISSTSKNSMFLDSKMKGRALGIVCNNQILI